MVNPQHLNYFPNICLYLKIIIKITHNNFLLKHQKPNSSKEKKKSHNLTIKMFDYILFFSFVTLSFKYL